jgi:2-(1,2-epoxy-1,2-dihydrophenyl)acetyl-CoA isomerase
MGYEGFILEKEGSIATITLNRPDKLNALTKKMMEDDLPAAFEEVRKDESLRVLIITGTGRGFCSGADVAEIAEGVILGKGGPRWSRLEPLGGNLVLSLYNIDKPVIGAINGMTAGAGVSLALLCDIRIASENARFNLAFVLRGLVPDCGATYTLPRLIGVSRALELMFTGDTIDAQEAERLGLVSRVVPQDELLKVSRELAEKIAQRPPIAVGLIKRAVYNGLVNTLEQQLDFETYAQNLCLETEDHKEAVRAFLEKRQPVFRGN